ncbi:hypothetical protein CH373_00055 [Leptospira perolatii]|uniref:Galactose oxidase n=1 Tax=Leptospira perolatii TaxID=2023191 RepID=A0A2M9ZR43_9LEPT|nr:FG-GAP repeat protein [Leptospira perolatii]PJZ70972.1 hypothetical protein CH360_00055 [Leptospira perolatii]PJZ74504.1 hypothetical protein CH373_00055 [Leptospira perolatii]
MKFSKFFLVFVLFALITCDDSQRYTRRDYIKVHNSDAGDGLGEGGIAIQGGLMVVGSPHEASSKGGVNPPNSGSDNNTRNSGAAYLFFKNESGYWQQGAFMKAGIPMQGANFGASVAIQGNYILVGAPYENYSSSVPGAGAVYVYYYDPQTRVLDWVHTIIPVEPQANAHFGSSITVYDTWLAIGAPQHDIVVNNYTIFDSGRTYLFEKWPTARWFTHRATLDSPYIDQSKYFGNSVSMSGRRLVVGSPIGDYAAIHIYERDDAGAWSLKRSLINQYGGHFGSSVAIDGDIIVVGAPNYDAPRGSGTAPGAGVAFTYKFTNGDWQREAMVYPVYPDTDDNFGGKVAISGNLIAVGALLEDSAVEDYGYQDNNNAPNSGAVFIFERKESNGTVTWDLDYMLKGTVIEAGDLYGSSVGISGSTIAIGASGEDGGGTGINGDPADNSKSGSGAAFVVERTQ